MVISIIRSGGMLRDVWACKSPAVAEDVADGGLILIRREGWIGSR